MTNEEKQPRSVKEAVDRLHANMGLNDEITLATINEENLIDVHFALGYHIRHEFGLCTGNSALFESCRVLSGDKNLHVDEATILIVRELWKKVKKSDILEPY